MLMCTRQICLCVSLYTTKPLVQTLTGYVKKAMCVTSGNVPSRQDTCLFSRQNNVRLCRMLVPIHSILILCMQSCLCVQTRFRPGVAPEVQDLDRACCKMGQHDIFVTNFVVSKDICPPMPGQTYSRKKKSLQSPSAKTTFGDQRIDWVYLY